MCKITTLHTDHGISTEQKAYIDAYLLKHAPSHFFIIKIDLPTALGTVPNAMYGPACGDPPITEDAVFYTKRGDREWEDRMIKLPPRPCSYVQAIGIREAGDGDVTVFTVYGGPLAPQHPDDPSNADPEASKRFWSDHALAD